MYPITLFISEVLANPAGADHGNEWFELHNPTSQAVLLTGWRVLSKKHRISLAGAVPPDGYVRVPVVRGSIGNRDPTLALYNPHGTRTDLLVGQGIAGDDTSLVRTTSGLAWTTTPTPAAPNVITDQRLSTTSMPYGPVRTGDEGLYSTGGTGLVIAAMLGVGIVVTLAHSHALPEYFTSSNRSIRGQDR